MGVTTEPDTKRWYCTYCLTSWRDPAMVSHCFFCDAIGSVGVLPDPTSAAVARKITGAERARNGE